MVHIPRYIVNVSNQTHNLGHSTIPQSFIQGKKKGIIVVLLGVEFFSFFATTLRDKECICRTVMLLYIAAWVCDCEFLTLPLLPQM